MLGKINVSGDKQMDHREPNCTTARALICLLHRLKANLNYTKTKPLFTQLKIPIFFSINPIQTGGGGGRRKVPALTLNAYNFFKIQPNAAKLCEFI